MPLPRVIIHYGKCIEEGTIERHIEDAIRDADTDSVHHRFMVQVQRLSPLQDYLL